MAIDFHKAYRNQAIADANRLAWHRAKDETLEQKRKDWERREAEMAESHRIGMLIDAKLKAMGWLADPREEVQV